MISYTDYLRHRSSPLEIRTNGTFQDCYTLVVTLLTLLVSMRENPSAPTTIFTICHISILESETDSGTEGNRFVLPGYSSSFAPIHSWNLSCSEDTDNSIGTIITTFLG